MSTFDIRGFTSRLPGRGIAVARENMYMVQAAENGKQIRAFSQGRGYKVTRAEEDYLILVDNTGLEHFVLKGKWMDNFRIDLYKHGTNSQA